MTTDTQAPATVEHPTFTDMLLASQIVDSGPVLSQYTACEWNELHEDGQVWIAAIVREAFACFERDHLAPSQDDPVTRMADRMECVFVPHQDVAAAGAAEREAIIRECADAVVEYARSTKLAGKEPSFLDAHRAIIALIQRTDREDGR